MSAAPERLKEIDGIGDRAVDELKLIKAAAERLTRGVITAKPALSSWSGVLDYLRLVQGFEHREQFRILFLDKKNNLIADEVQGRGTVRKLIQDPNCHAFVFADLPLDGSNVAITCPVSGHVFYASVSERL